MEEFMELSRDAERYTIYDIREQDVVNDDTASNRIGKGRDEKGRMDGFPLINGTG